MDWISDPNALVGLLTLLVLEIVLNIDNIIFITILAGKLPVEERARARTWGLAVALVTRVLFLLSIAWVLRLTSPLFGIFGRGISGRDLILIIGGLFLIAKATHEIHSKLEGAEAEAGTGAGKARPRASLTGVVLQIAVIDIVFSIDSVVTAVGMVKSVTVMIIATVAALIVMMVAAGSISEFVERHPTVKMLALAFLLMIGGNLIVEGFGYHVPKGYTYFAMAFSVFVEMLNIKLRSKVAPVHLHGPGPGPA